MVWKLGMAWKKGQFCVYKITNLVNGKMYIGKTGDPEDRWKEHQTLAKHPSWKGNYLIHTAMSKYGIENFAFEVMEEHTVEQTSLDREVYWIVFYKTNVRRYGEDAGYNLTDGGQGYSGHSPPEEVRKKISEGVKAGQKLGEDRASSKLTNQDVIDIKHMLMEKIPDTDIAKKYGVHRKTINEIKLGEKWTHIMVEGFSSMRTRIDYDTVFQIKEMIMSGNNDDYIAQIYSINNHVVYKIRMGQTGNDVDVPGFIPSYNIWKKRNEAIIVKTLMVNGESNINIAKMSFFTLRVIQNIRSGKNWKDVYVDGFVPISFDRQKDIEVKLFV